MAVPGAGQAPARYRPGHGLRQKRRRPADLFSLGFTDFRVRMVGRSAKIQLPAAQMPGLLEHRQEILQRLGPDYDGVWLDLEGRE